MIKERMVFIYKFTQTCRITTVLPKRIVQKKKKNRREKKAHYEAFLKLFIESFQDVSQFYHLFSFQC